LAGECGVWSSCGELELGGFCVTQYRYAQNILAFRLKTKWTTKMIKLKNFYKINYLALGLILAIYPLQSLAQKNTLNLKYGIIIQLSPVKDSSATTKIAARVLGGEVRLSDFEQKIDLSGNGYKLAFAINMPRAISLVSSLDKINRASLGYMGNGSPLGFEISEQRGSSADIFKTTYDPAKKTAQFYKNKNKTGEVKVEGNVTDLNSLNYFWLGKKPLPAKVTLQVLDSKKVYKVDFVGAKNVFMVGKESVPVIQYRKLKENKDDADLTITVRESDGFPVRVDFGLSAKEGVKISIFPLALPKEPFQLK